MKRNREEQICPRLTKEPKEETLSDELDWNQSRERTKTEPILLQDRRNVGLLDHYDYWRRLLCIRLLNHVMPEKTLEKARATRSDFVEKARTIKRNLYIAS